MSKFYVGQKVKKVRGPKNIGLTGTVVLLGHSEFSPDSNMRVRADAPAHAHNFITLEKRIAPAGSEAWTDSSLWEPIIPDGLESLEEINALWQTEPEKVSA